MYYKYKYKKLYIIKHINILKLLKYIIQLFQYIIFNKVYTYILHNNNNLQYI